MLTNRPDASGERLTQTAVGGEEIERSMDRILLVSSERALSDSVMASLPPWGELITVSTLAEARQAWSREETKPFLILADIGALTGLASKGRLSALGDTWSRPPVIALISELAQRDMAVEAGVDDYWLLPLLPSETSRRLALYRPLVRAAQRQEAALAQVAQAALVMLISKLIGEHPDLNVILSRTLEQTVSLLAVERGEIWLFGDDRQCLYLAASLSQLPVSGREAARRTKGEGLIGWVAESNETLVLEVANRDKRYNPHCDALTAAPDSYSLLAVGLKCEKKTVGVLAFYKTRRTLFSERDVALIESIAALVAAAIVNAQGVQAMRLYAEQQRTLYEMSQQLSASLDIHTTLNRAVQWLGRLVNIEVGLIWLADDARQTLRAVAALGAELPAQAASISLEASALPPEPVILTAHPGCPPHIQAVCEALEVRLDNGLVAPMREAGQIAGMVMLVNKIDGPFTQPDLRLLTTAVEIIMINLKNARLHTQLLHMMEERERLHQQALQGERLRTIGRLTASLAHEINNPMQAIQGALELALEDPANRQEVEEYIRLSQQEASRVVKVVSRMRQLYRPSGEQPEIVLVPALLREILKITREEIQNQHITLKPNLPPDLPPVLGVANQLYLAFLSIVLHLTDAIGSAGGGGLAITASVAQEIVWVEFSTPVPMAAALGFTPEKGADGGAEGIGESIFGLASTADTLRANGGVLRLLEREAQTLVRVELPILSQARGLPETEA